MSVPEGPETAVVSTVTVEVVRAGEAVVLVVAGEVDLLTAPEVESAMLRALDQRPDVLVVDLLRVTFLASAGLAALMKAHDAAATTRLRVVAAGSATLRPLEITGLTAPLAVFATREEALRA
ncbi:STAS domain-containing protein [Actinophytocola sp.]|uniref:STAS domain-containing protein n=1 Tax=Actinophytocola sp. TaxID=1872138 RepID=UPI002D5CE164|nr:STAS domain-containing protein [Actinophytocola sp.]HYQ69673.1 STAS domain-containing protein [Actinophytocola sp.]